MSEETCANCGNIIGKLQIAYIFNDKIVCHKCNLILKDEYRPSDAAVPPAVQTADSQVLQEINESTGFLATVVWVIIILTVIGVIFSFVAYAEKKSRLQQEYNTLLGVK